MNLNNNYAPNLGGSPGINYANSNYQNENIATLKHKNIKLE